MSMSRTSVAALAGFLQRIEGEARGVGADIAGDDGRAGALAPDLELIDGGGAEGVAGRQHDAVAFTGELRRQLADGGRLAAAVDAEHEHDVGLARSCR